MPQLQTHVTLTPLSGAPGALALPGPNEVDHDGNGNVTFTWTDALKNSYGERLTYADIEPYLSTRIDLKQNRSGAKLVVTDQGGSICTVEWTEVDPWSGATIGPFTVYAVVALSSARHASDSDGISLVCYEATHRYERVTGTLESVP